MDDFQFVAIATDKMENGQSVFDEMKKGRSGGMPWMVVLDGEGNELVTSVGPKGNVGCPVEDFEIEHFVDMIRQGSDASDSQLDKIKDALNAHAAKINEARNKARARANPKRYPWGN